MDGKCIIVLIIKSSICCKITTKKPSKIYFIHGEPESATDLAHAVKDELGIESYVPEEGVRNEI